MEEINEVKMELLFHKKPILVINPPLNTALFEQKRKKKWDSNSIKMHLVDLGNSKYNVKVNDLVLAIGRVA